MEHKAKMEIRCLTCMRETITESERELVTNYIGEFSCYFSAGTHAGISVYL